ncbi:peptide antibiotic transporter SbmA [Devosia sp. 63-57]|uniref:peptide antibiotic transporter SbmA n=1 Tax=Devosia sp. 63-57 TaxID=1895751 RepID=UPI00086B790E|nr:peptide antibiotic transporter SbmA [Devosia sp. 63-57]ODT49885.1 MAG: microcin B17 transporter [Pelagibacterium sp. SCN 63-126]ODU85911.1 MAG: microcin B17 transporter [Pelagibacterium sp. SCN 63-17]OJX45260.1 MAG: peptide transporter [Devosia sp. 63-57]
MFRSFFPNPKLFFGSALAWTAFCMVVWFTIGPALSNIIGLGSVFGQVAAEGEAEPFLTPDKVWLYQFVVMSGILFCIPWYWIGDNRRWYWWSVVGSVTIIEVVFFDVQIGAWMNAWYGEFYNMFQGALTNPGSVSLEQIYGELWTVLYVLLPRIAVLVLNAFFIAHYLFRWRRAMTFFYMSHWPRLRGVEGASQRIQEDTQRFANIVEGLAVALVSSIMTLLVFLPLLWTLSQNITELPIIGPVNGSLVWVALMSAVAGTVLLGLVGIKLPGLEFQNQRVEAAFRKELVYGEDDPERARPLDTKEFFLGVQRNYFRLYGHYLYFNVARYIYLQGANFVPLIAMSPSIAAGALTLGLFQQVSNAFGQVEDSFRFLANSWTTIISLISVYKRLRTFEANIPPGAISGVDYDDPRYLATEAEFRALITDLDGGKEGVPPGL